MTGLRRKSLRSGALGWQAVTLEGVGVADREGFEPSVGFHLHTLSKRARSTTPPPVRFTLRLARRRRSIRREAGLIEHTRPLGKRLSHPHMDFNAIFR